MPLTTVHEAAAGDDRSIRPVAVVVVFPVPQSI